MINYNLSLKNTVEKFTKELFYSLFDNKYQKKQQNIIKQSFCEILSVLEIQEPEIIWASFKESFLEIRHQLDLDALAFEKSDPACKSLAEVYLAYPGFHAIAIYRLSNKLFKLQVPILPRMMSEYVHGLTGTDIHPGAEIGESFFIDHATGIVIGETTVIKENVKIYQGVTLGGLQVKKSLASVKRHPTIEKNVTIYANATILGGDVVVGENSIIGANVCVIETVPKDVLVTAQSENNIIKKRAK